MLTSNKENEENRLANGDELSSASYFDIKVMMFDWNNANSFLLLFNDISSKFRETQIKELHSYKQKILESVSHNLKTPMHCVRLYLDLLREDPLL